MAEPKRVNVEVIGRDTVRVPCCPACGAPATADHNDGGGYHCTACEWRGDGYVTMWSGYPNAPQMAPAYINGPFVLTGGRIEYRTFQVSD